MPWLSGFSNAMNCFQAVYSSEELKRCAEDLDESIRLGKKKWVSDMCSNHIEPNISAVASEIPREYRMEQHHVPFLTHLTQLGHAARLNCAIVHLLVGDDKMSQAVGNIICELKKQLESRSNLMLLSYVKEVRIQALDDFIMAFDGSQKDTTPDVF
jgi:hypothetical protein